MLRLAEIDLAHARVARRSPPACLRSAPSADQHRDRSANRNTRSMSCSMKSDRHVARQRGDHAEQLGALADGMPAAGSSSSSTRGSRRERQRDLQQPLLAVGKLARRVAASRSSRSCASMRARLVDLRALLRDADCHQTPPSPSRSQQASTTDSSTVRPGKQRVDLERARHAALDARVLRQAGDALVAQEDLARARRQHAGQQVDERGLAGAVRPDERVARAGREARALTSLLRLECAPKCLRQALRCAARASWLPPCRSVAASASAQRSSTADECRRGANSTISTSSSPSQNCQYTALEAGKVVLREHEDRGADQRAVQAAGAAEHQHDHQLRRARESRASRCRRIAWSARAARRRCRRSAAPIVKTATAAAAPARRSPASARRLRGCRAGSGRTAN